MRHRKFLLAFVSCLCVCFICIMCKIFKSTNNINGNINATCEQIDVVYTWVNGSDANFILSISRYDANYDRARFDDKQELRYSLRSLEVYAPWVRHVYIITNGQIPHWLDLNYNRVSIITHELLTLNAKILPTFSSAAIETFLHRIPNLSKRFLYMNDDIFLGAPLYPEDLYTESEGVRIYRAWAVPDCSLNCAWASVGDGICDHLCYTAECQFDGGDCDLDSNTNSKENAISHEVHNNREEAKAENIGATMSYNRTQDGASFMDMMKKKKKQLNTYEDMQHIVYDFNKHLRHHDEQSIGQKSIALAVSRSTVGHSENSSDIKSNTIDDFYSESLKYTNMLLNRHYGFKARDVLAHVGFLLDKDIIEEMQKKFRTEFEATSSHRFRTSNDLQFAFFYYWYLMSEKVDYAVEDIFNEFDTDSSRSWSDREIRTFLARIYPLPLELSAVRYFEEVIENCSRTLGADRSQRNTIYPTIVYERYQDSNMMLVTRNLVTKCALLADALSTNFATRPKYKFSIRTKSSRFSNFMMLTSNISNVVNRLDEIRRSPKKFNCINDNLDHETNEENDLIRRTLEDFYLSYFPHRSKFELQEHYRNRFTNWSDYQKWRSRKLIALCIGYSASVVLIVYLWRLLCFHRAKFARRYVQRY